VDFLSHIPDSVPELEKMMDNLLELAEDKRSLIIAFAIGAKYARLSDQEDNNEP
jgi:hypothetical protein